MLAGVTWCLTVTVTCFSLTTNRVDWYLFMYLLAIRYLLWKNVSLGPSPIF